jgi:hypothetical protein
MAGLKFLSRGIPGMRDVAFPPKKRREVKSSFLCFISFIFCTQDGNAKTEAGGQAHATTGPLDFVQQHGHPEASQR